MRDSRFHGELIDCDTHLYVAPDQFEDAFGRQFARRFRTIHELAFGRRDVTTRARSGIDATNVWEVKHWDTPGSYDVDQRMIAIDSMGIDTQILFPDGIVSGILNSDQVGAEEAARQYNHYALQWAAPAGGRLRPASVLRLRDLGAIEEARRLVEAGAYGFTVYCGRPPAGLSPAHPAWDEFWSILADAGTPLLLHSGSERGFLDKQWVRETPLDLGPAMGAEGGPFALATSHLAPAAFVTALTLGGVLARHPALRVGILEFLASWIGPLAELLDHSQAFYAGSNASQDMKPSDYIRRQVRITPFFWEPIGKYIERYGLEDCYVFSSDYPHEEGGVDPVGWLSDGLDGCSDVVARKVFVESGRELCPALS